MDVQKIEISRADALKAFRAYQIHKHYAKPIDDEVARTYNAIAKGRVVIKALESIRLAGRKAEDGFPKLAICRATAKTCFLQMWVDGSARMAEAEWTRHNETRRYITFPAGTFTGLKGSHRWESWRARAQVPLIPIDLRPKRGLENYHVLWEAEWSRLPPHDPMLLRRMGKADLWIVLAHWDLTEVERAALATRL